ncbi:MAG: PAS domain S-box protein, partial [Saprospiraceae bacterium]
MNSHHFEALFKYSTICILISDSQGRIIAVNPFALREFGYEQDELLGQKIELLIPGRFHSNHEKIRDNYYLNPHDRPVGINTDLFACRKDGSEFPVEVSLGNYLSEGTRYVIAS